MYKINNKEYKCSIEYTIHILNGKWRALILWHICTKTLRFNQLQKIVPTISKKVLSEHLRELEKNNLIMKKIYPQVPPKVEYSITDKGKTLQPILDLMEQWGTNILGQEGEKL